MNNSDNGWAINTEVLTRQFGKLTAVDRLDLNVPRGVIFGFLGPNGAGKSTTINMLVGLLRPTSGRARVAGFDVQAEPLEVKRRIGVVPEGLSMYERLTAFEQVELVGRLHGLDRQVLDRRIPPLLEMLDLHDSADKMILDYSAGMRKKTAMAAALIHAPEVLFLDEPFESVDPISTRAIKNILRDMVTQRGTTVFFSTHVMELAERFCDQVGILNKGTLVATGSIPELRQRAGLPEEAPLEDVFLHSVQAEAAGLPDQDLLAWLTGHDDGAPAGA
ncbi:MAG: ABC transporter ATP-binding protein [Anaerolineae bacterium]|nr:ABC transporter ATP-binding protein [Anaerolineae bacterium]MDX9829809.1 ABC transporter ATP-binding protein [Anaerolineae bacterium]